MPCRRHSRSRIRFCLEQLEDRCLLSAVNLASIAVPIALNDSQPHIGIIQSDPTYYRFSVAESGRFTAEVAGVGVDTRLSLLSADGRLLMQSDGQSLSNRNDLIDLHLLGEAAGTTYYLEISALSGSGSYTLTVDFKTALPPFQPLPVGTAPWYHVAADLNNDGHLDLAVANFNSNDLSVLFGLGDGTFAAEVRYAAGAGPNYIVAGDFNNDGHTDLATANLLSGSVSVLLGLGNGRFAEPTVIPVGVATSSVATGHFNADSYLDLIVADYATGQVSLLVGGPGGIFVVQEETYEVEAGPYAIAAADLNADGHLDVVTVNYDANSITVLFGQGNGRFDDGVSFATGEAPYTITIGDFNGDQLPDLATANYYSNDVSVLLNLGSGTFAADIRLAAGRGANGVVSAYLNRDNYLDLAVANYGEGTMSVFMGNGDGTFAAATVLPLGSDPTFLVAGDFNEDGAIDLAGANITPSNVYVMLNLGDGTFRAGSRLAPGGESYGFTYGDFNEDGHQDLVTTNYAASDVMILLGRGDGTYQLHGRFSVDTDPGKVLAGDFNGDNHADLIITSFSESYITLLLGLGDGSFGTPLHFEVGGLPLGIIAGYFDADDKLDIATADFGSGTVSVLLGRGKDAENDQQLFLPRAVFDVGTNPSSLVAGHFDDDHFLDLAVTNAGSGDVTLLAGDGQGGFTTRATVKTGGRPRSVVVGDFGGDGRLDFAVADSDFDVIRVLINQGDYTFVENATLTTGSNPFFLLARDLDGKFGTDLAVVAIDAGVLTVFLHSGGDSFQTGVDYPVGSAPVGILVADLNSDGITDLATQNSSSSDLSLLFGTGDGTFDDRVQVAVVSGPTAIVEADFDGDGRLDVVTANPYTREVSIQLGLGSGAFQEPVAIPVGVSPRELAVGDFNRDGRPDLIVADYLTGQVWLLLGFGDGSFRAPVAFQVGNNPTALATGDFNRDGLLDVVVANFGSNDVSLLLGRGDGSFQPVRTLSAGSAPTSLVVGDFNRDGRLDIAVGNYLSRDIAMLLGRGDGNFQDAAFLPLPAGPGSLVVADFDNDGWLDLAAAHPGNQSVSLLLGDGNGGFLAARQFSLTIAATTLVAADFDQDGFTDLAAAASDSSQAIVLLGDGSGALRSLAPFAIGKYPMALAAADFNRDGYPDLASANGLSIPLSVVLGRGDGGFEWADEAGRPIQNTPLLADLNGDGLQDVAILRRDGAILVRMGRVGDTLFEPPVIINPDPKFAARDVTLLAANGGYYLVTLEAHGDTLSTYVYVDGAFVRLENLAVTGSLPSRLVAGDLNGDGLQDIVVAAPGSHELLVGLQLPDGTGYVAQRLEAGHVSDIVLIDIDGRNGLDIVVTDQLSGDVRIFFNDPLVPFTSQVRYRSGLGLYSVGDWHGPSNLYSHEKPVALAAVPSDTSAGLNLIVVNSGSNSVTVLRNNGLGGLFNPEPGLTLSTGLRPTAVVTGLFNADSYMDFAVLNSGSGDISVFLGDGNGGYREQQVRPAAGNLPGGLTASDIDGDGRLDLLIGNQYGDVLTLLGKGDGSFEAYRRAAQNITLAVADFDGDGVNDYLFGNAGLDRVSVHYAQDNPHLLADRNDGLLAPGALGTADLNGDGLLDLVIANSGGNNVLVYLGVGNRQFAPARSFFVGTNPGGVTIRDVNGDGLLDLVVANTGSNDVSILLGQGSGDAWTLTPGPRLNAGAGPVHTVVADVTGNGVLDILVANSWDNNVYLLAGSSQGFFNDAAPQIYHTGVNPTHLFVGHFDAQLGLDLVTVNATSNNLSFFSNFGAGSTIHIGGARPVGAFASDLNQDGLSNLIVADRLGQFSLLQSSDKGMVISTFATSGLVNLSDIALGNSSKSLLEIYATVEGSESAHLVRIAIPGAFADLTDALVGDVTGAVFGTLNSTLTAASFSFSSGSMLEIVATLLMDFEDTTASEASETAATNKESDDSAAVETGDGTEKVDARVNDADEVEVVSSDDDVQRNNVITGALEVAIEEYLAMDEAAESASIRFPAPLEVFDAGQLRNIGNIAGNRVTQPDEVVQSASEQSTGAHANEAMPGPSGLVDTPVQQQPAHRWWMLDLSRLFQLAVGLTLGFFVHRTERAWQRSRAKLKGKGR